MNTMMRSRIYLPIAALILTAALAVPAAAQKQVPFKGAMQGREIDTPQGGPPPTTLLVDGRTRGIATLVGQFSFTYQITVNLANDSGIGSAQLIAANGDSIFTTIVGQGEPTDIPGVNRIVENEHHYGWHGSIRGSRRELHR